MNLIAILAATLIAGIGSVWLAALLLRLGVQRGADPQGAQYLLSLAAGALLATAFMHLLPEAFESHGAAPAALFGTLLFGLVLFFLLEKAELWHHGHENHLTAGGESANTAGGPLDQVLQEASAQAHGAGHSHHHHHHHHGHGHGRKGGWTLLTGDSVHCFGDGILIASAFIADMRLGVIAAIAVLAHEVPHHIGDLVVLRQTSPNPRAAIIKVSLAGTMTALGGLAGWLLVDRLHGLLPYLLVLASSSFIYVALADLIPQLQRRLPARQAGMQILWLAVGIALVTLASWFAHADHGHGQDDHGHEEPHAAHSPTALRRLG